MKNDMISLCLDPLVSWWAVFIESAEKNAVVIAEMAPKSIRPHLVVVCWVVYLHRLYLYDCRLMMVALVIVKRY